MTDCPLHLRRAARRHRDRVSAARARRRRGRPQSARARALPRRRSRARAARRRSGYVRRAAPSSCRSTTSRLIVPLTDLDQLVLAHARDELGRRSCCSRRPTSSSAVADKYLAHVFFERARHRLAATWLPGRAAGRPARFPCSSRRAKASARATSTARDDRASSTSSSSYTPADSMVQACLRGRGVLDRRLLRPRRPLPERDPAHDDRVEGRRVDQGHDDQGPRADRLRPPRCRDAAASSARRTSSASASPTAAARDRRQPALRRRLPAPARRRRRAIPSSRSRSPTASVRSRALGDFREAS